MSVETLERDTTDVALVPVPQGDDAYKLFTAKDTAGADRILAIVRAKIDAFKTNIPDATTASGRKEIASFAFKIAKSKTAIEEVGAAIAKDAKDIPKRIDANRKRFKDTLDAWRDEVRQPVTDWEAAEEDRINAIKSDLAELQGTIDDPDWPSRTAEVLGDRLKEIERDFADVSEARFGEYAGAATELKAKAIEVLNGRVTAAEKREAEAAELERLRAEAAERERKDREAEIARNAAENAKREAEAKAEAERLAAQKREDDLKAAAAKAEEDKRLAEERAINAAREAKEAAEREAKARQEQEEVDRRKREADTAHKKRINRVAIEALVAVGVGEETAKTVIKMIATGKVPNVTISY